MHRWHQVSKPENFSTSELFPSGSGPTSARLLACVRMYEYAPHNALQLSEAVPPYWDDGPLEGILPDSMSFGGDFDNGDFEGGDDELHACMQPGHC